MLIETNQDGNDTSKCKTGTRENCLYSLYFVEPIVIIKFGSWQKYARALNLIKAENSHMSKKGGRRELLYATCDAITYEINC